MKIVLEATRFHRFALYFSYTPERVEFCRILRDSLGWKRFSFEASFDKKRWIFSETIFLQLLTEHFPDIELEPAVLDIWQHEDKITINPKKKEETIDIVKEKQDTDFVVNGIKGELYPYQKVGIEFLLASGGRAIIADQMGLGKTVQALGYSAHSGFERTLVICPASVKPVWEQEIKKWTKLSAIVIDSKTKVNEIESDVQVWIINYDILRKHLKDLLKIRFDLLIADEAHYCKSINTIRTKAVRQLTQHIPHIVFLTGTPLLSRPVELFSLLNMIDAPAWPNWYEYTRTYCDGKQTRYGYDASGATNIETLHHKIKKYFIRRQKSEVLGQLPPKNYIDVPVELESDVFKQYNAAEDNLVSYLKTYKGKQPAEIARVIQAEKLAQLTILRQLCAMGKIAAAKDIIEDAIDAGEKILVFSSFTAPLHALMKSFPKESVMITGETPVEERGEIVKAFQTDPNIKIFFGGYKSAGVGITLTAASNFVGIDFPWNPADLQQSIDRLHRPGQEASMVNIYQLVAGNTVDQKMQKILDRKSRIFDQVIDGQLAQKDETNAVQEVLDDLMIRKGAQLPPMILKTKNKK